MTWSISKWSTHYLSTKRLCYSKGTHYFVHKMHRISTKGIYYFQSDPLFFPLISSLFICQKLFHSTVTYHFTTQSNKFPRKDLVYSKVMHHFSIKYTKGPECVHYVSTILPILLLYPTNFPTLLQFCPPYFH